MPFTFCNEKFSSCSLLVAPLLPVPRDDSTILLTPLSDHGMGVFIVRIEGLLHPLNVGLEHWAVSKDVNSRMIRMEVGRHT